MLCSGLQILSCSFASHSLIHSFTISLFDSINMLVFSCQLGGIAHQSNAISVFFFTNSSLVLFLILFAQFYISLAILFSVLGILFLFFSRRFEHTFFSKEGKTIRISVFASFFSIHARPFHLLAEFCFHF